MPSGGVEPLTLGLRHDVVTVRPSLPHVGGIVEQLYFLIMLFFCLFSFIYSVFIFLGGGRRGTKCGRDIHHDHDMIMIIT